MKRIRIVSALLVPTYLGSLLLLPAPRALAAAGATTNALNVAASSLPSASVNCDNICSMLVLPEGQQTRDGSGSATRGAADLQGLTPGQPWQSPADDQWCAQHGSVTDAAVGPGPSPAAGVAPAPVNGSPVPAASPTGSCNVPMTPADGDPNDPVACQAVNQKLLHCKLHNSQVETQCLAYYAASDAETWEKVLAVLDGATTAICATACFGLVTAGSFDALCQGSSVVAGATEFVSTVAMKESTIGTMIDGLASTVGTAAGVGGFVANGGTNELGKSFDDGGAAGAKPGAPPATPNTTAADQGSKNSDKSKVASCISAASFAILTGLRVVDIISDESSRSNACQAVQNEISGASTLSSLGSPDINNGNYTPGNGSVGNGSGGGAGVLGSSNGANTTNSPAAAMNCIQAQGLSAPCSTVPPQAAQATDGGLLNGSGLDRAAAPLAATVPPSALTNPSAGSLVGGMMGGGAGSDPGFAALAQAAQDHAPEIAGAANMGVYSGGGGGGSRGGGGDTGAGGMFGNLFGAKDQQGPQGGAHIAQYGRGPSSDIWHTGTPFNLFEIVSQKITKVTYRVVK